MHETMPREKRTPGPDTGNTFPDPGGAFLLGASTGTVGGACSRESCSDHGATVPPPRVPSVGQLGATNSEIHGLNDVKEQRHPLRAAPSTCRRARGRRWSEVHHRPA